MAFTGSPVSSTEYASQINGKILGQPQDAKIAYFSYTHAAGAGTGEINLIKLPAGQIRIFSDLSRIVTSQFAVNADLHLGHRAYTEPDGDAVAEDDNEWLDNADAGGGALDSAWVLPADGSEVYNTVEGLTVYAMVDTANIEDADTIEGWVVYACV